MNLRRSYIMNLANDKISDKEYVLSRLKMARQKYIKSLENKEND